MVLIIIIALAVLGGLLIRKKLSKEQPTVVETPQVVEEPKIEKTTKAVTKPKTKKTPKKDK